jgi:hypothetical protein
MFSQLDRLKKDYKDLKNYESKILKLGKKEVAAKLKVKRDFLGEAIYRLEEKFLV